MPDNNFNKTATTSIYGSRNLREIAQIVQWLLIALILALYFRGFVMEAYRIPTGSMATTLKGSHFRLCCRQCGYRFERDFDCSEYNLPSDTRGDSGRAVPHNCMCPICGYDMAFDRPVAVANGDRILVLKCLYQFFEPERWDIIVFRDPSDPGANLIKRLVGLPGETIQIIDGDIYINGEIVRKSRKVQKELWIPVYDNDYQPVHPERQSFNGHSWVRPIGNSKGSKWQVDGKDNTRFALFGDGEKLHWLDYNSRSGDSFRADNAYNGSIFRGERPYCSDIMVRFYSESIGSKYKIGAQISKYGQVYTGYAEDGRIVIEKIEGTSVKHLAERPLKGEFAGPVRVSFAVVDHFLIFRFGKARVVYDLGKGPDDAGARFASIAPVVRLFGSGSLLYSHLAIYRDIYYTNRRYLGGAVARACAKDGFSLGKDEFFVFGDNSPVSFDSRWWHKYGFGNNKKVYRAGIVPRDYLLGKAIFVYWPSGFRPFENFDTAFIPNIGQMRFIYGGKRKE